MESSCVTASNGAINGAVDVLERKEPDLEASTPTSGSGRKSGGSKDIGNSILKSVNKSTLQIKKPPHRRSASPLNWFPRKKTDSYLKRKIRHLQEVGGMNLSLDETLGNANPHYTRMAREKIAAREAARKAMEARKAAMVEASWCRILQASRIQSKEAVVELEKAEKSAAEAFEVARAMGVMMYDRPDCPRQPCEIETSASIGGRSTHTVTASFETAFEVDKEVAAAVKKAFILLANCPSASNKEEFRDLLRKISQNPDTDDTMEELSETSSECEPDPASNAVRKQERETKEREQKNSLFPADHNCSSKSNMELVDVMLDRLKGLQEDELSSLAVIVATCGLNAALLEVETGKEHDLESVGNYTMGSMDEHLKKKETVAKVPNLDKFLVKHVSRLEREVQEARNLKNSKLSSENLKASGRPDTQVAKGIATSSESTLDLGSILVKHVSRLEREIQEAKRNSHKNPPSSEDGKTMELNVEKEINNENGTSKSNNIAAPSSGSTPELGGNRSSDHEKEIISHEKECKQLKTSQGLNEEKENIDSNMLMPSSCTVERAKLEVLKETEEHLGLVKILVKPVHRLEKEKMQALQHGSDNVMRRGQRKQGTEMTASESLDKVLVKHVSRLEKEKLAVGTKEEMMTVKKSDPQSKECVESLDGILVKHQSKLEKAKLAASQPSADYVKHVDARREARERELQEAWGGLSLGNSIRPHLSRLEREKAAWRKAEEEERRREMQL
ncbi:calponin domain-containing protein [Cocos nucifera]|uniref:Calponin domain-containing protein n=1 Tax=Cocos nucifera TaxID=13894 RepID=A0A8K0NDG1_COCNU|nr:calponin domain-containing protein [Cocos nucifera]